MSGDRIRIGLVGGSDALASLRAQLESHERIALVTAEDPVAAAQASDVVLLESAAADDPALRLAALREATSAPAILLAVSASASLVERALDAGAADVLVQPYDCGGLLFAVEKAVRSARLGGRGRSGRVLTVFSPKGGSGKSVLATNLASLLAHEVGGETLLVDLDLQFGDAAIMLDLRPDRTIRELIASPATLDSETIDVYTQRHRSGLAVLPAPLHPEEGELVDAGVVRTLLGCARSSRRAVVVDTSPFFHESTLASLDVTDDVLVVCTPDVPTVKNVRLALDTLDRLALAARVHVVLNRDGDRSGLRAAEVADALGRGLDAVLPFDAAVPEGVNRGVPAALGASGSPFARALAGFAADLFPSELRVEGPPSRPFARRRRLAFARG